MKTATAATLAILNTTGPVKVLRADLYTYTLKSGTVLRVCDADRTLVVGGLTFNPAVITRSKTKQSIGITVDSVQVVYADNGSTLLNGKPIIHQFRNGLFKGATVKIQKLFLLDWNDTSPGPVDWFEGIMGAPSCDHLTAAFEIKASTAILNKQMPEDVYQPTCCNSLFDTVCGASAAAFTFACTTTGIVNRGKFTLTGTSQSDGYFALGKIKAKTGANAGMSRTVKSYIGGVIEVFNPFPYDFASGDQVDAVAGCDKLQTTCNTKFNRLNPAGGGGFDAQPYIPVPETAVEGGGVTGSVGSAGSTGKKPVGSSTTANKAAGSYVN